eukprot:695124-Rhodomonas_salina.1
MLLPAMRCAATDDTLCCYQRCARLRGSPLLSPRSGTCPAPLPYGPIVGLPYGPIAGLNYGPIAGLNYGPIVGLNYGLVVGGYDVLPYSGVMVLCPTAWS